MIINNEIIQKMINNDFELDCVKITLTQQVENDPIIYSGPGTIYQDKKGTLNLKMYHTLQKENKTIKVRDNLILGKIICDEMYYHLEAIDISGDSWISENILLSAFEYIIKAELKEIRKETELDKKNIKNCRLYLVVPGNFRIPCNQNEELPNGGWKYNTSIFSKYGFDFEFKEKDNFLELEIRSKSKSLSEKHEKKILEALSIILGQLIKPVLVTLNSKNSYIIKLKSKSSQKFICKLNPPFHNSNPNNITHFQNFICKYFIPINTSYSDLFEFWFKVYIGWQTGVINASLLITVSIEGILKTYFKMYGLPDDDILTQAKDAKYQIEKIELGKRIENIILNSISNIKNSSPKSALREFQTKGWINNKFIKDWIDLRNKSTHSSIIDYDPLELQKDIDRFYTCLTLFYILVFLVIGYNGKYYDYSQGNWPEKDFNFKLK